MKIPIGICIAKNVPALALFVVAAIQTFAGENGWFVYRAELNWLGTLLCFSGFIYIVLGIVARWFQLCAALIGTVLYAAFLSFESLQSLGLREELLMSGLSFKIPVVVLLLVAVGSAFRCPRAYKVVIMTLAVALLASLGFLVHAYWLNSFRKRESQFKLLTSVGNKQSRIFRKEGFVCLSFMARTKKTNFLVGIRGRLKSGMQNMIHRFMMSDSRRNNGLNLTTNLWSR